MSQFSKAKHPSIARLGELLSYDPETGEITNKVSRGSRALIGQVVGGLNPDGYRTLCVEGQKLLGSRVAWALFFGRWPRYEIGHIDGNRGNDSIKNLVDAPRSVHHANSVLPNVDSKSPALGVRKRSQTKRVQAFYDGKHLGYFDSSEQAQRCVWDFKRTQGLVYRHKLLEEGATP